eukprot:1266779-Amphidinium_carterae.1
MELLTRTSEVTSLVGNFGSGTVLVDVCDMEVDSTLLTVGAGIDVWTAVKLVLFFHHRLDFRLKFNRL